MLSARRLGARQRQTRKFVSFLFICPLVPVALSKSAQSGPMLLTTNDKPQKRRLPWIRKIEPELSRVKKLHKGKAARSSQFSKSRALFTLSYEVPSAPFTLTCMHPSPYIRVQINRFFNHLVCADSYHYTQSTDTGGDL